MIAEGDGVFYAGVDEAGLFVSRDGGVRWQPVPGLNDHETRSAWCPGAGGLCAHSVLFDSQNPQRVWCGISAVGVFRSDDGGETWQAKNVGVPVILEDEKHKEIGFCVHGLAQDPENADRIYRQDHQGMYRSSNGGDSWEKNEAGLVSGFGFPIAIDRPTRTLFAVPLESDECRLPVDGKFRVYRSRDEGDSWEPLSNGLPQKLAYMGVLRRALTTDHLDPGGVYVGTTSGTVHVSHDLGDSWQALPCTLPRILNVSVFTES